LEFITEHSISKALRPDFNMKRPETPPSDDDPFNLDVDSPNKEEPGAQKTQPTLWMSENRLSLKT
jgi:hypothetical protein